jgi:uncharacterized RDD family membrane protein YckC
MICTYCRTWNPDDEHRCGRCGRRMAAGRPGSEQRYGRTDGALATAPATAAAASASAAPVPREAAPQRHADTPPQGWLFERPAPKVIPFESFAAARIEPLPPPAPKPAARRAAPPPRRVEQQPTLDFLPPAPATPRTLGTTVEAVIYCDAPVATVMHRVVAAALDAAMVLIAFGVFLLVFHLGGGEVVLDSTGVLVFGGVLAILILFYGVVWLLAGSDTAGSRWTGLRLINFDGFPPDGRQRALRFAGTCLSFSAAGLGILWALVDEESLTWQDHMSQTFQSLRERDTTLIRRR